jgi:hypothetical protein
MLQKIDLDAEYDSAKNWRMRAEELLESSEVAHYEACRWEFIAVTSRDPLRVVYAQRNAVWFHQMSDTYLANSKRFRTEARRAEALGRH